MKNMKLSIFIVVSALVIIPSYAGITLNAYDEYGQPPVAFNVGVPFTVEVALQDIADIKERPTIKGLQGAYVRDNSMMTMSINGKTTVKYSYKVRFDTVGTYEVGPATIEKNGQVYSSNTITIKVVDQPTGENGSKETTSSALFVRMKVDKNHVVVGEKFKCILRCYYTDQVQQVAPSSSMQLPGFVFEDGVQQAPGVESIKGVKYNYFELSWNAHATQPGKKTIPAFSIDYMVNSHQYGSHASAIAMMFGHSFGERKRAHSNIVPLIVDELPAHEGPIHAIGTFTHFVAKLDPTTAKQGEGMVLTLEIGGQGTFHKEHGIELQHMPPQLKYYDSKHYEDKANGSKKYFEFIVQGLEKGEWHIPCQQFTFFDTRTRTYKTLYTNAIPIRIIPQTVAAGQMRTHSHGSENPVNTTIDMIDDIKPLLAQEDAVARTSLPSLPTWLMFILIVFPLGYIGYEKLKSSTDIFDRMNRRSRKKNAFIQARKEVRQLCAQQRVSSLYRVFVQLFAIRCSVDEQAVNQEFMYEQLKKSGMHQQELEQWNQFYNQLCELMFFDKHIKQHECHSIQQYAYRWIDRLEKIV